MKKCFIFGALDVIKTPVLPKKGDLVLAADKGYLTLKRLDIEPDLTVGDFDSLGNAPKEENVIRLEIRKDDTDTAHCVEVAREYGFCEFVIYGAAGGKIDHTFANIQLASNMANRGERAVFIGEKESFCVIKNGSLRFDKGVKGRISVFSLCDESHGVTEKGLSYSLENATLNRLTALGVSNEFTGEESEISVKDGELLVVWDADCLPII